MIKNIIKVPNSICFRVTRFCNARCPFCLAPMVKEAEMTLEEIKKILDIFKSTGLKNVKLCGGEPYTRQDMDSIIKYCRDINLEPSVSTNAIILNDKNIDIIATNKAKVKISLHGLEEHHNKFTNFDKYKDISKNIKKLIDKNVFVGLYTIVNSLNIHSIDKFIKEYAGIGIKKISFITLVERGRQHSNTSEITGISKEHLSEYLEIWKKATPNIDLRLLDFSKDYYVVESNKSLWIQRDTDSKDTLLSSNILSEDIKLETF